MKKLNKKTVVISSSIILCVIMTIPTIVYADGFSDTIIKMIGKVIAAFADGVVFLCNSLGGKFDKLIFNYDGSKTISDFSLMLLKNDTVSKQVLSLYVLMRNFAIGIIVSTASIITLDFRRAGQDPRHKAVLKVRLQNLLLSLLLLHSIPVLVDVMLVFNGILTDTFRLILKAFTSSNSNVDFSKSFLTEIFKNLMDKKTGAESLILSLAYLISAFLNIWLIIFYMIRDLTISFLLIFAPILVSVLPFRTDLFFTWLKEMFSNIITQAIQALVFLVIVAIATGLSEKSDLYADVYALVAFALFIPITAIIKKLLGLEGNIGAAKSAAGIGAAAMTLAFAGKAVNGIKNQAGMLKDSHDRVKALKSERDNLEKRKTSSASLPNYNSSKSSSGKNFSFGNLATSMAAFGGAEGATSDIGMGMAMGSMFTGGGSSRGNFNMMQSKQFPRDRNTIQGEINSVRKQAFKSLARGTFSGIGSAAMAIGGSSLGPMGAFAGMQLGNSVGDTFGNLASEGVSNVGSALSEKGNDILYGEGIRPELAAINNGNRSWSSLDNVMYNMKNMRSNLSNNRSAMKSDSKYGWLNTKVKPHTELEKDTLNVEKEIRQDEMTGLTGDPLRNTPYYENEKNSRIQTQKLVRQGQFAKASWYRLQTSSPQINKDALNSAEQESYNPSSNSKTMLYTDKNSSILFNQNSENGEREILATYSGNPNLETPTMESVTFNSNGDIPVSDMQRSGFREQAVNIAVSRYGESSINNQDNQYYKDAQTLIEKETNNLINQHISRNENMRHQTGNNNIVITGTVNYENVDGYDSVPNAINDVNIDIPSNLTSQHSQDIYTNIKMSDVNLSMNRANYVQNVSQKQSELINKQAEYMQQRQYTENLIQGANEIHYRTHNSSNINGNLL